MASAEFEIVESDWPENVPAPKKALRDFLASGLSSAEIKGPKDFLVNVRRAAKSNEEFRDIVELRMKDNRMFIRRRNHEATA